MLLFGKRQLKRFSTPEYGLLTFRKGSFPGTHNLSSNSDSRNCHLSSIHPRFISDLNKVVVLPCMGETFDDTRIMLPTIRPAEKRRAFTRVQTAPASSGIEWGSKAMRQKNASSSHVLSGASREHIDLYLGNNNITKLPPALFTLHDLRILSLST
jgi:hypothetical protein